MALRHCLHPVFGLQFHPEAILTEYGFELLHNFLQLAGLSALPFDHSLARSELRRPALPRPELPESPVTF